MTSSNRCRSFPRRWRTSAFALIWWVASVVLAAAATPPTKRTAFDIPATSALQSFKLFAAQAGVQLLYAVDVVDGVTTNPIKGQFTPREAMERMLAGTTLAAQQTNNGAIAVRRETADPKEQRAAPQTGVRPIADGATVSTVAKSPNLLPGDDAIVQLTPFEVTADLDRGYRAGGTLAGTRLRSDLRDVAASVSVATKDLMNDIAANDLGTLLNYTLGTEVTGVSGNFSGTSAQASFVDYDSNMGSPTQGTRVRGLTSADTTRDYFLSDVPTDGYIMDRVEISRGANSILFGLGSPGGIINHGLIKAGTRRNETEVQVQLGRFGTHRENFDHNQVLVKDRLALRLATLHGDRKYQPESTFSRDKRAYATTTYRPFERTTIRASAEWAKRNENKPWSRPPYDQFTHWWAFGKPIFNPSTNRGEMLGTPAGASLNGINPTGSANANLLAFGLGQTFNAFGLGLIYENPNSSVAGITGLAPGTNAIESNNERMLAGGGSGGFMQIRQSQIYNRFANGGTTHPFSNFWRDSQITDPSVFDFYNQTLEGRNKSEWASWNTTNITLDQGFLNGLAGLELAADKQNFDAGSHQPLQFREYTLCIDINTHLPNGAVNPNYGRPYVSDFGYVSTSGTNRLSYRATAYADVDARKYLSGAAGRILGRHVFTLNYTSQERRNYNMAGRPDLMGMGYSDSEATSVAGLNARSNNTRRALTRLVYLGPSVVNAPGPQNLNIQPVTSDAYRARVSSVNALYYQSPPAGVTTPAAFQYKSFDVIQNTGRLVTETTSGTSRGRQEFEAGVAVMQSRWLDNTLVTTLGWRRDDYKTYSTSGAVFDDATGVAITNAGVQVPQPDLKASQETVSYGMVAHTPEFIQRRLPWNSSVSLTYNKADNFRPTNQRYDFFERPIDPEMGTTKEHGALVTLFGGKFELRATSYKSTASFATNSALRSVMGQITRLPEEVMEANSLGQNDDRPEALAAWRQWERSPVAEQFFKTFRYAFNPRADGAVAIDRDDRASAVLPTSDVVSKGWEYEAVVNPNRNWRIAFNAARQEAVRTNTGKDVQQFLDAVLPVWAGTAGELRRITNAAPTDTLRTYLNGSVVGSVQKELMLDGSARPELRKWRWNVITNYTFSKEGRLNGFAIGGSARWQDKVAIGYPVIVDPLTGPRYDVTQPYYGAAEANYDAWLRYGRRLGKVDWRAQLNVRNIGVGDKLIPITTQPDGSIAAYRVAEPMVWTLSNTFKF